MLLLSAFFLKIDELIWILQAFTASFRLKADGVAASRAGPDAAACQSTGPINKTIFFLLSLSLSLPFSTAGLRVLTPAPKNNGGCRTDAVPVEAVSFSFSFSFLFFSCSLSLSLFLHQHFPSVTLRPPQLLRFRSDSLFVAVVVVAVALITLVFFRGCFNGNGNN